MRPSAFEPSMVEAEGGAEHEAGEQVRGEDADDGLEQVNGFGEAAFGDQFEERDPSREQSVGATGGLQLFGAK